MTPYAVAAAHYLVNGWSPIPLPFKEKAPPPVGYTGAEGKDITATEVKAFADKGKRFNVGNVSHVAGNVGLRLPKNVIGIDIDMYGTKTGAQTMKKAIKEWGPLPATWASSSRDDGSRILFYRIPEGLGWPGQVGPGVETLRWDHRYAVVYPSVHPEGQTYQWIHPDGQKVDDEFPAPEELPELPDAWVKGLTNGKSWAERAVEGLSEAEVKAWLYDRAETTCDAMRRTLTGAQRKLRAAGEDGGAHEVARDGAWALIGDAGAGHGGVVAALAALRKTFLEGVKDRRTKGSAEDEWKRAVIRGVQKVAAEGEPQSADICDMFGTGQGPIVLTYQDSSDSGGTSGADGGTGQSAGSSAFDYARDDAGNAQRLKVRLGTDAHYVPELKGWAVYQKGSGLWEVDPNNGAIMREAIAMVRKMDTEAEYIEDPKAQAAFRSWVRSSGNVPRLKAMIELCGTFRDVCARASRFDARSDLLVCPNGTVELKGDGATFRGNRHADYSTLTTGTDYRPDARSEDWELFLKGVLPDPEDLLWVQTLAGYSLLGSNPERAIVFAKGPTTTGKTTFALAVMGALGDQAAAFNLSLLRDKQDEGPRVDMVTSLPKRLLVASEADSAWQLHADAIKRVTGGERMSARLGHSNQIVQRTPAFTMWITTNEMPTIPGADSALWKRIRMAPFVATVSEEDSTLSVRLSTPEARAAILAWCVRGWDAYCRDGLRKPSHSANIMEAQARGEMSELDEWLEENCEYDAAYTESLAAMYQAFTSWQEINGSDRRMSRQYFGRLLTKRGIKAPELRVRQPGSDNKLAIRLGIRLKAAARIGP